MLLDQQRDRRGRGQAQKPHPIELRLLALDDVPNAFERGGLREPQMEQVILLREALRVVAAASWPAMAASSCACAARRNAALSARRTIAGLQRLAHEPRPRHRPQRDPADKTPALRAHLDQPFLAEPDQCLAHRRAARAEPRRQFVLRQPLARP